MRIIRGGAVGIAAAVRLSLDSEHLTTTSYPKLLLAVLAEMCQASYQQLGK